MKLKLFKTIAYFVIIVLCAPLCAINDLSKSDPAYKAIKKTLDEGYLSLYNNQFNGDNPVSRKEIAIAIHALLKKMDQRGYNLSKTEVKELVKLSKTYKTHLQNIETATNTNHSQLDQYKTNTLTLQHDLTKLNDELRQEIETLKKENQEQHLYMIIGIGAAMILGIAQ